MKWLAAPYLTLLLLFSVASGTENPNFIIVLGDDVGWDAFGCTGNNRARTPAIDQLAEQSCKMNRFYCAVSQCAPLRAELYTGLYPNNNGVMANGVKEKRPGVKNVADYLLPLDYRVGWTGKKHFSLGEKKLDSIPGFDSNGNGSNQTHSFDGVRSYIEEARKAEQNFCIFICSTHAHHPWDHGVEANFPTDGIKPYSHYIDTPATRQAIAKHAAEVEVLDQQVKETRELIHDMNLEENTVLIFLSEQGIAMPRGKWSPYEHGSRALCLAYWKDRIIPRSTDALSMYCDIVPTLIDFAGGNDPKLDGKSLKSLWTDKSVANHRDAVLITNVHPFWQKAIVKKQYKLIWTGHPEKRHIFSNFNSRGKFFSQPWSEWQALAKSDQSAAAKVTRVVKPAELELYDVVEDPYELNDLAKQADNQELVTALKAELVSLMESTGEPLTPQKRDKKKKRK